jgi:methylenetetrahydrofolate reductase (NADPH)
MPFSFELYPARSETAAVALAETVRVLAATNPDFISVTYGASGSNRDASFGLLDLLLATTDVTPLAHLTTVGSTRDELVTLINGLMDAGIYDFLALRGDPPADVDEAAFDTSSTLSSADLVRLIGDAAGLRGDDADRASSGKIAVAAYPNGHQRSVNRAGDIAMLIEKQEAGADFAITQLFFYADDYLGFVAEAKDAGLRIPVLPGLMPVSTSKQLRRIAELAGQDAPSELLRKLDAAGGAAPEIGIEHTVELGQELLAGGAPSLHLYTFNKHEAVLSVLNELNLV